MNCFGTCASPKLHPVEKLNRRLDILTVKSRLDRPNRASWKAMKTSADGILARHRSHGLRGLMRMVYETGFTQSHAGACM